MPIVFVMPEYHGSISGILKNTLDYFWMNSCGSPILYIKTGAAATVLSSICYSDTKSFRNLFNRITGPAPIEYHDKL